MYFNIIDIVLNSVISHKGEKSTSYITRPHLFAGRVFAYIGVQMALPLLIISSIKKVANKISRLVDNKTVGALGKTSTPDLKFQPREIKVKSVVIFTTS